MHGHNKLNIFLTGDSRGIGKAIYEYFVDKYNVFGISRNGKYKFDLIKDIDLIRQNFKDIFFDIIILNAGIGYFGLFKDGDIKVYEDIINLNLVANIKLLKLLNYDKDTKIIFIGSIISKKFMKNAAVYQASKFGLRGFAGGLKKEGYKCHIINPKIVDTDFHPKILDISSYPKTDIKDIICIIENIIENKEKKFEIDL